MTEADPKTNILGHFEIQGVDHAGGLKLDGMATELQIYSEDFFHLKDEEMDCVRGVSNEGVSISALHCVPLTLSGSATYHGKHRHYITLRPNFVTLGPRHLEPAECVLTSITFGFSDANNLFYDWGTFGSIFEDRKLSFGQGRELLRKIKEKPRHRRRGGWLRLYYHWDRGPIVETNCAFGKISVWNATSGKFPSPNGIELRNKVRVTLEFGAPVDLDAALKAMYQMVSLFELTAQVQQDIEEISLRHAHAEDREASLSLHVMHAEHRKAETLHPTDALLNGGLQEDEFARVLARWMDTTGSRDPARQRFIGGFRRGSNYTTDRLVGAANAFDLLPSDDFMKKVSAEITSLVDQLIGQVRSAAKASATINESKEMFLNNLGRIGDLNLRSKVLQRWSTVPPSISSKLAGMPEAIAHSVQARNFFVHGSEIKTSKEAAYELAPFFTDTLEFVFGISELCTCGWNADRWATESYSWSRFKWYISNFSQNMERLSGAVAEFRANASEGGAGRDG
ncbi:hypothetical protein Q3C01_27955 [Bradyrhizobium sp. UFLA05-109]